MPTQKKGLVALNEKGFDSFGPGQQAEVRDEVKSGSGDCNY